jgi:Na+/proline symporter
MDLIHRIIPILFYVGMLLFVTWYTGRRNRSGDRDYFLAGRSIGTFRAILSVVATETSVATIVMFPAAGMEKGLALLWLPAGYVIGRVVVAGFYLERLYSSDRISIYGTICGGDHAQERALGLFYLIAKYISNGVRLFLGGYALQQIFGWDTAGWIAVAALSAGLYSLTGGLRAVVFMDQIQGYVIYSVGLFFIYRLFMDAPANLTLPGLIWNSDFGYDNASNSLMLLIGGAVLSIGTHGADQDLLQRVLGTKSINEAKRSMILSGLGAFLVILIYLVTGLLLGAMHPEGLDKKSPLIDYIMKTGNPMIASLLAVLIFAASSSTLDSCIHSTGAVWKSLMRSRINGRYWSALSLIILVISALVFVEISHFKKDFLTLAMGSMSYINGGLIAIFTRFIFFPDRVMNPIGIVATIASGFTATLICDWAIHPAVAWTWTVLISSGVAFLFAYLFSKPGSVRMN